MKTLEINNYCPELPVSKEILLYDLFMLLDKKCEGVINYKIIKKIIN